MAVGAFARAGVTCALVVGLIAPISAAQAVPPQSVTWQDPAPRSSGDGLAATSVGLTPRTPARLPDGDVVVVDTDSSTLRAIDGQTGVISRVAGNGTRLSSCTTPPAVDVTTIGLPVTGFVGADASGDIYVMAGGFQPGSCYADPVLRLDHVDHTWHVAVRNRVSDRAALGYGAYSAMAVAPDGTVYVTDRVAHVVRAYAPGSDPDGPGVIVAGTVGASGVSGDGGAATSATINEPRLAATNSAVFLVDTDYQGFGEVVRRVLLSTGIITRVAGSGARASLAAGDDPSLGLPGPSAALSIDAFSVDAAGSTVYMVQNRGTRSDLDAIPVGGVLRAVASDVRCGWGLLAPQAPAGELTALCATEIRGWASDGSAVTTDGVLRGGLDTVLGNGTSPDGVPLSVVRPGEIVDIAVSSSGAVALAGPGGVRTVSAVSAASPVRAVSRVAATAVAWGSDGALFWIDDAGAGAVVRRQAPGGGAISTLMGGGAATVAAGVAGTAVRLPHADDLAVDVADHRLLVLAGTGGLAAGSADRRNAQIWALDLTSGTLDLVAGDGTGGPVTDGTAAPAAALGSAYSMALDTSTDILTLVLEYETVRIVAGVVRGPVAITAMPSATAGPGGRVIGRGAVLAADGTLSTYDYPSGASAVASRSDGSLVAAVGGTSGGLLRTSTVLDPYTAATHPAASVSAVPGEGTLTVTVVPPAVAGLEVTTTVADVDNRAGAVVVQSFITNGSTAPRVVVVHRSQAQGEAPKPARVLTGTYADSARRQAVRSTVLTAGADVTAPPKVTELSFTEGAEPTDQMFMRLPDVDDLFSVRACVVQGSTPVATVSNCSAGSQTAYITYPLGDRSLWISLPTNDEVDRSKARTYSVFLLDRAGNASRTDAYRGPAVAAPVAADVIRGITWVSTPDGSTVTFSMRGDPDSAAIVEGTAPPAPVQPNGGIDTARTWTVIGLVPGRTYTARFFVWNATRTTFTPTDVTFAAGTSAKDEVSATATAAVEWGRSSTVSASVTRAVTGSAARPAQAFVPVELWKRVAPSTVWVRSATGTTDAAGRAGWTVPSLGATTTFQVRVPAQGAVGSVVASSPVRATSVRPRVTRSLSSSSAMTVKKVKRGKKATLYVTALPKRVSTVLIQRLVSGTWKTVATRSTSSSGTLAWSLRTTKKGSIYLRAVVSATATTTATTTGSVRIKVV